MIVAEQSPVFKNPGIDGVRRSLERTRDDDISDDYWRLIDRATEPGEMTPLREHSIASKLWELHCREGYITSVLELGAQAYNTPDLVRAYQSVIAQIVEITGIDTDRLARV